MDLCHLHCDRLLFGAEGDALGYLVSRCFGLRAISDFDASGSYSRSLTTSVIAFGAGAFVLLALGRYPPELDRTRRSAR